MRPVDKGTKTKKFTPYGLARIPLSKAIGWYCSYCEMPVKNNLNVEHVIPRAKGGAEYEWENFLLACNYCNGASNKSDNNDSRVGYFWPDKDNTFRAFEYDLIKIIIPDSNLTPPQQAIAQKTIDLMGLDRTPYSNRPSTLADIRWEHRETAWGMAIESLKNWELVSSETMKKQIILTATGTGFFSIWMKVFDRHQEIKLGLIDAFVGTAKNCFDIKGNPIPRANGVI